MFASLLAFLGFENAQKLALKFWAITTLLGFFFVMWSAGQACANFACASAINAISSSHPSFAVGLSLGFNPITYTLASAYVSVWAACQLYIYKKKLLGMIA